MAPVDVSDHGDGSGAFERILRRRRFFGDIAEETFLARWGVGCVLIERARGQEVERAILDTE